MTPEQILIDGLKEIAQAQEQYYPERPVFEIQYKTGETATVDLSTKCSRILSEYNEAKAREANVKENLTVQDLLTASPDRAALLTASPLADACEIALSVLQDVDGTSPEYDAIQYAIAQSDELIDHSKKVWDLLRVRRDTHGLNCVFYEGEKHCNCGLDEYTEIKESLPDDILVLMEVGNDDY